MYYSTVIYGHSNAIRISLTKKVELYLTYPYPNYASKLTIRKKPYLLVSMYIIVHAAKYECFSIKWGDTEIDGFVTHVLFVKSMLGHTYWKKYRSTDVINLLRSLTHPVLVINHLRPD